MNPDAPRWQFIVRALGACILWGSAFPAIRLAQQHMPKLDFQGRCAFAGWRFLIAGLILLFLARQSLGLLRSLPRRKFLAFCFCQIFITYILFYWGMAHCGGSLAAICMAAGNIWWLVAAPLFDRSERWQPADLAPVLLGLAGVAVCLWDERQSASLLGVGLILAAAFTSVSAMLFVKTLTKSHPLTLVNGSSMLCGALALLLCSGSAAWELPQQMDQVSLGVTLWLIFISVVAFSVWYSLIHSQKVARLSSWRLAEPVSGVLLSILILGEHLSAHAFAGAAITFGAILLCEKRKAAHAAKES